MKREDVTKIFEGATKEQIDQLLDINSADIGAAKKGSTQLQADLDAANKALTDAKATITTLEASKGDAEKLQAQIDDYKKAEAERTEAEKAQAAQAALESRFDAVSNGKTFIHDLVRKGVLDDFGKALADKGNVGKSDADVFTALTQDKNYFSSQNPAVDMGGIGNVPPKDPDMVSMRHVMGLADEPIKK